MRLMEVCGTHTHNIFQFGIRDMLPARIKLISGPGCPVCVTPAGYIDQAAKIALDSGCTVCTFGDMIRVPGNNLSLAQAKAEGGSVQIMYSPMDVLKWAQQAPDRLFCVTAVGFETTLPVYALLVKQAAQAEIHNIRLLTCIKALMPALYWICENNPRINGFIGPGHVSAIVGSSIYEPLCSRFKLPLAIGGFGFEHIVAALYDLVRQCSRGTCEVHNLYPNAVSAEGNTAARSLIAECFVKNTSFWRGLGEIPESGYCISPKYQTFDMGGYSVETDIEPASGCLCANVITGSADPPDCVNFGYACMPEHPLGPCMVSAEGTCGIWIAGLKNRQQA